MQSISPKVSIITAVYNAEKYINGCITSVLGQNYENFEYIIIDGGSTDNTISIIEQYKDKLSYWISEPDRGIYDAWNKGLAASKGEWIAFLGSDDLLYPDAIQTYVNHIIQHPKQHELEFVSSRIELVKQDLTSIRIVGEAWDWERFKYKMITWHVGCFHAKHLFTKYGYFDPAYKVSGDYELLLRPTDKLVASFVDRTTVKMRMGGVSDIKLIEAHDETFRAKIKNGAIPAWRGELLKILYHVYLTVKFTIKR
ncbi:glycosyltransferase family 2 protein [Spirosoma validum]|uniref:Glycosyltransferase n=1 Tax=Spirosoma validum TaxID=2771355 RepID=A0A927GBM6_9BACT|nr:glycosyltransferase family 2 protein [Spirosoma validum]MBD2751867.1 glycosyltransferase [Spirosoma validum]